MNVQDRSTRNDCRIATLEAVQEVGDKRAKRNQAEPSAYQTSSKLKAAKNGKISCDRSHQKSLPRLAKYKMEGLLRQIIVLKRAIMHLGWSTDSQERF
ncbi:hypothetical protein TWF706_011714 [Orbilia oligospora]|nr:hypothetical protein TWF706_011714 [Orbilia oligospora]